MMLALYFHVGQETTANMLCFSFILIHQHPQILKRYKDYHNTYNGIGVHDILIATIANIIMHSVKIDDSGSDNRDIQSLINYSMYYRLRSEIVSVMKDKREFCAEDLDKLHFMEQVWTHKTIIILLGVATNSRVIHRTDNTRS